MNYKDIAQRAVEMAQKAGATQAEAFIDWGEETEIVHRQGRVDSLNRSESGGLGLRVIRDGRLGFSYTSDLSDRSLKDLAERTVAAASEATPDECNVLPEAEAVSAADLAIYDPKLASMPVEEKIDAAKRIADAAAASDERVCMVERSVYQDAHGDTILANSNGFVASYKSSFCVGITIAIAQQDSDRMMGLAADVSRTWAGLDLDKVGADGARRACVPLGGKPMGSKKLTVVMEPPVAGEFMQALTGALSARLIQTGRSMFIGKMGQKLGADSLTLIDDGRMVGGIGSVPFDGEGVPSSKRVLIDKGTIAGQMHNAYTSRKDGVKSTGNASRDYRSTPVVAPQNPQMAPGDVSPEAIIAGISDGVLLVEGRNVGGINPITGMYSVAGFGQRIENGKLTGPVSGITVSGTMLEMMRNLVAVGNDFTWAPMAGNFGACTIAVDGMTLGGA